MAKEKSKVDVKRDKTAPATVPDEGWAPFATLRDEIDRLFDDFGRGFWPPSLPRRMRRWPMAEWAVAPAFEVVEGDDDFRITAELPGMKAEEVEVKLGDGSITIRGEKSEERKEEKENYLVSERRYGEFQRSLALPSGIDLDAVKASFADGVLTVTMPKSEEAKQKERKIEVNAA